MQLKYRVIFRYDGAVGTPCRSRRREGFMDVPSSVERAAPVATPSWTQWLRGVVRLLRPRQWTKNALLLIGVVFSLNIGTTWMVVKVLLATLVFSLSASACYCVNDVLDRHRDKQHPRKRSRPVAAGVVSPAQALLLAAVLLSLALPASYLLEPTFALVVAAYLALTVAYSLVLKEVVLLDVFAVAAGFVLRAVAGAVVIQVPISPWLYVCTVLGALFLALVKRRQELVVLEGRAGEHRRILDAYGVELLDQLITIVAAATAMAYSLYTFSAENLPDNHLMMLTIPVVLYGLFRYLWLARQRGVGGAPEDVLWQDRPLALTVLAWGALSVGILYLGR